MKKGICLILLLVSLGSLFAVEDSDKDIKAYMDFLLTENLSLNLDKVSTLSEAIPVYERYDLYNKFQIKSNYSALLNASVGFGLGSFLGGDKKGGIIGTCWDSANFLLLLLIRLDAFTTYDRVETDDSIPIEVPKPNYAIITVTSLSIIASRVFQVIRANVFKEELNQSLLESLGLKDFQSGFEPLLTPEGNLGMSFKVKVAL